MKQRILPLAGMLTWWAIGCDSAPSPEPVTGQPPVGDMCEHGSGSPMFASCVADFTPAPPASFGHDELPDIVLGPPMPGPSGGGSLDVASLGCGGSITVGFVEPITDHAGDDFVVFENPFITGDTTFAEPARVLVSDDGRTWFAFECAATEADAAGCAGVTPTAPATVTDGDRGGDAFDLDELGLARIRWVRLVDATREYYGDDTWCTGAGAGFDLDAVARVGT